MDSKYLPVCPRFAPSSLIALLAFEMHENCFLQFLCFSTTKQVNKEKKSEFQSRGTRFGVRMLSILKGVQGSVSQHTELLVVYNQTTEAVQSK